VKPVEDATMTMQGPTAPPQLVLSPDDHGREVSSEEFAGAEFLEPWTYERAEGKLVVMPPDGQGHIEGSTPWLKELVTFWARNPEVVEFVVPNAWMHVDGKTDHIGDIGVYLAAEIPTPPIPDRVPEMIFEIVSPGRVSRHRDDVVKRAEYHGLGVMEYVIVDRADAKVTVLELAPGDYRERILGGADEYTSPLLPGIVIRVGEAFGG